LGVNDAGQLGRDTKTTFSEDPEISKLQEKGVKCVAAGADFSIFLT